MSGLLRIGEAAKALGVTPRALRLYEKKRLLPPPRRSPSRYRLYDAEQVDRVRFILATRRLGMRLQETAELLRCAEAACCGQVGPALTVKLRGKLAEVDARMRELRQLRKSLVSALNGAEKAARRDPKPAECSGELCLPRVARNGDPR